MDEGFGTLDSETLDAALNALESLRLSGRTIGVISHIEALTRRIHVRIDMKRTGVGTSTIHVKGWGEKYSVLFQDFPGCYHTLQDCEV